jgi:hypothetical protein
VRNWLPQCLMVKGAWLVRRLTLSIRPFDQGASMSDLLADFLKQGMAALEAAPFDFFGGSPAPTGIEGVHAAVSLNGRASGASWASRRSRGSPASSPPGAIDPPRELMPLVSCWAAAYAQSISAQGVALSRTATTVQAGHTAIWSIWRSCSRESHSFPRSNRLMTTWAA